MRRTFTLFIGIAYCSFSFGQWNSFGSGFLGNKDQTIKDGTYYMINYPNGVQATTDFTNWNEVNTGLPLDGNNIFAESLGNNSTHLFCGTHSGVYRSDDDGANWSISNGNLPFSSTEFVKKFYEFNGDMYAVINTDIGTGGGLYISTNNGNSWFGTAGGMSGNATIYSIMEHNGVLYANTNVALFSSSDWGANWNADPHFNYAVFAFWATDIAMIASTTIGFERSTNGGTNWNTIPGPDGLSSGEAIGVPSAIYIGARGGNAGIWISTDDGLTWSADNSGISVVDQTSFYQFYHAPGVLYLGAITDSYSKPTLGVGFNEHVNYVHFMATYFESRTSISVNVSGSNAENGLVELYDLTGKKLNETNIQDGSADFDTSDLSKGVFIVRLTTEFGLQQTAKVFVH